MQRRHGVFLVTLVSCVALGASNASARAHWRHAANPAVGVHTITYDQTFGPRVKPALVKFQDSNGVKVGTARLIEDTDGVTIRLLLHHLPPGTHGIHLHAVGSCVRPDFASAGAHFEMLHRQHGRLNNHGPHAGDLPNLQVNAHGRARKIFVTKQVTLSSGDHSLFHPGGTSIVIHAGPDDEHTDPSGNSGARIACGVVER